MRIQDCATLQDTINHVIRNIARVNASKDESPRHPEAQQDQPAKTFQQTSASNVKLPRSHSNNNENELLIRRFTVNRFIKTIVPQSPRRTMLHLSLRPPFTEHLTSRSIYAYLRGEFYFCHSCNEFVHSGKSRWELRAKKFTEQTEAPSSNVPTVKSFRIHSHRHSRSITTEVRQKLTLLCNYRPVFQADFSNTIIKDGIHACSNFVFWSLSYPIRHPELPACQQRAPFFSKLFVLECIFLKAKHFTTPPNLHLANEKL